MTVPFNETPEQLKVSCAVITIARTPSVKFGYTGGQAKG